MADSGLVVVLCVVTLLLVVVFLPLLGVEYKWCHVLFDNSTVSKLHIEKVILTEKVFFIAEMFKFKPSSFRPITFKK